MVRLLTITILIISALLLAHCNRAKLGTAGEEQNSNTKSGIESCSISSAEDDGLLAVITCPDGSSMSIPKVNDGENGSDGAHGVNGTSCSVDQVQGGAMIVCSDNSQAFIKDGADGHSCGVSSVNSYASLIECTDGSSSLIDLSSMVQYFVEEIIDPCGDDPNNYDEVLMKFNNGDLLAYFQSGSKRFLTLLTPGSYQTTDAQKCKFSIDSAGNVIEL